MKLNYFQLMSPNPVEIIGVGRIKCPTVSEVYNLGTNDYGQSNYDGLLNVLAIDTKKYFEVVGKTDAYDQLNGSNIDVNMFDIWCLSEDTLKAMIHSLSFFIVEKIVYDENTHSLLLYKNVNGLNKIVGVIDRDNYSEICDIILQLNYIDTSNYDGAKPKNKKAAQILEKLRKAPQLQNKNSDKNFNVTNIISSLCTHHNSYNLTNIWSLTIYQLYDQFTRQSTKNQIDISALRWAAWGSEAFDFDLWFKSLKNKN